MYGAWEKSYVFTDEKPFAFCHAPTIAILPNGDFLVAWFAGTSEGHADTGIWCSRLSSGKWSPPCRIAGEDDVPHWNPVFFLGDDGLLRLFYKTGHTIPRWQTNIVVSSDCGTTWTAPVQLVQDDFGGRGPVRNKPIITHDGVWLAPASLESEILAAGEFEGNGRWDAFVDISRDWGKSWEQSSLVPVDHLSLRGEGIIQPALWESAPGRVHMLLRSTEGMIYRSDSSDGGRTWNEAYATSLPNNNSGIDLVKLQDHSLLLVYNPVSGGRTSAPRTPLVTALSRDNGMTWEQLMTLEDGPGAYCYPSVLSNKGNLYIAYTWNNEKIAFWSVS